MYTNVAIHRNEILVCGYLDGERYTQKIKYKPYLFVPAKKKSPYKNLQKQPVERMDFETIRDARDFYQTYSDVEGFQLYGMNQFIYPYIYDNFPGEIKFDASLIKVHNIDIETGRTESGAFADVELANGPITLIGIGIKKERYIFGYKKNFRHPRFVNCKDEKDMLQKVIKFWSDPDLRPDVITGWNCEKYDMPFLINRIRKLLGDTEAKKLSPWGILKEKKLEIRGREVQVYEPVGISILDYYDLYKKFTYSQQESYTLDHIAFVETGKRKLDFSEVNNLDELYETNFEKYVEYNITDIDRVADIDEKNKFIELVYAIAYDAKVNFVDALTSVRLWDVIIHNNLMDKKIVIPKDMRTEPMTIPGGYVKQPQIGMHEWVVSFDLQSLYPHLIMSYNISPETMTGIEPWTENDIQKVLTGEFKATNDKESFAANGARFSNKFQGFLPELMKIQFKKRAEYKAKMLELKKNDPDNKNEIQKYHNYQLAKKIQLNSAYGALANEWFRFYDWRLASAITLSGQLAVRWIEKKINIFMNSRFKTKNVDYVIAMDTDSCYIKFNTFHNLDATLPKKVLIDTLNVFCESQVQPAIDKGFAELAKTMNAYENAMVMKRDVICDKVIWREKKNYVMNIWDQEGVRFEKPQLKIMGLEAVKAVIPQACRSALKEAISIIMNKNEADVIKFIEEFRKTFDSLAFHDVAFPRGVNGISKYMCPISLWKKGAPVHVKGSIVYNKLLKDKNLQDQYPLIYNKDKIKFCYLKMPNPTLSPVIAVPRYLPEEFGLDKYIDRDLMWEKTFMSPLQSLLNLIGWRKENINTLESFF